MTRHLTFTLLLVLTVCAAAPCFSQGVPTTHEVQREDPVKSKDELGGLHSDALQKKRGDSPELDDAQRTIPEDFPATRQDWTGGTTTLMVLAGSVGTAVGLTVGGGLGLVIGHFVDPCRGLECTLSPSDSMLVGFGIGGYLFTMTLGSLAISLTGDWLGYDGSYNGAVAGVNLGLLSAAAVTMVAAVIPGSPGLGRGFYPDLVLMVSVPVGAIVGGVTGYYLSTSTGLEGVEARTSPALLNRSRDGWSLGVPAVSISPAGDGEFEVMTQILGGTF